MPDLPEVAETYFGAGTSRPNRDGDVSVRPFKIEVEDKARIKDPFYRHPLNEGKKILFRSGTI